MAAFTNTEFEFGGINHLALTCSDMQRTVDFYTNILGMKLVKTLEFTHDSGSGQHFFFDVGNGRDAIAFFWFDDAPPPAPGIAQSGRWLPGAPRRSAIGAMDHVALDVPRDKLRPIATSSGRRALPSPRSSITRTDRASRNICPRSPTRTPLYGPSTFKTQTASRWSSPVGGGR